MKKSTFVYIDGFNLYYRLKKIPFKWLNLEKFAKAYLDSKRHDVQKIKKIKYRVIHHQFKLVVNNKQPLLNMFFIIGI